MPEEFTAIMVGHFHLYHHEEHPAGADVAFPARPLYEVALQHWWEGLEIGLREVVEDTACDDEADVLNATRLVLQDARDWMVDDRCTQSQTGVRQVIIASIVITRVYPAPPHAAHY